MFEMEYEQAAKVLEGLEKAAKLVKRARSEAYRNESRCAWELLLRVSKRIEDEENRVFHQMFAPPAAVAEAEEVAGKLKIDPAIRAKVQAAVEQSKGGK